MALLPVTDVYQKEETNISSVYTIAPGPLVSYYKLPAFNDATFTTSSLSHLWGHLSLRTQGDYNTVNQTFGNGGWLGTALEPLVEAFGTYGAIGFSVNNTRYRTQIHGSNIGVMIPVNSTFSGSTSGLSATTLYSSLVYNSDNLTKNPASLCSGTIADSVISDSSREWTNDQGIGFQFLQGTNPNPNDASYTYYDSGIVYLMSDVVYNTFSGATGSSSSWNYLFGQTNKYANGARQISTDPSNTQYAGTGGYDRIAGVVFLNFGFGIIFDKQLVQAFDQTKLNGDWTTITGATTTSGFTNFVGADYDIAEILNIDIVAKPDEWPASSNSSYIGTGEDCGVAVSTIALYDEIGQCLAIAKPDEAIIKEQGQYLILNLKIPVSEDIQSSLADTIVRNDCGVSGIPC
jgi:hypothetical protein